MKHSRRNRILAMIVLVLSLCVVRAEAGPGDLDTTFDPGLILWEGFEFPAFKYAAVLQSDGKVVIGGHFDTVGGVPRVFIARLNANGSLDTSFAAPLQALTINGFREGEVYDIIQQPDGKFIVSGYFGVAGQWKTVVRLNNDGSLDASFNVTTNNGSTNFNHIYRMLLQPDGKIIIGSNALQSVNGVTTNRLARLNPTGALDAPLGVTGGVTYSVFALALQPDGKIVVGGDFGTASRLLSDGTPDPAWTNPDVGLGSIHSMALEPDGQVLIGSNARFTVNGVLTDGLLRLNTDGSIDFSFNPPDIRVAWTLYVQSDGKIAVGGSFTINFGLFLSTFGRLNPDGSLDFMCNSGPDNDLLDIVRQPDGKYIVTGTFETYFQGNEQIVRTGVARVLEAPSPLAGKIVYNSRPDGINLEIYSMNADGSNQLRLTTNAAADYDPSLSSDGSKVAFISDRDKNNEIYVMNADGTGQTRLTNNIDPDQNPSFSTDGSKIVFSSLRDGNWEIYIMDANGLNQTRLTNNGPFLDDEPSFSPDGSKIVFRSNRDGNSDIYVMDTTGANPTRLTFDANVDNEPVFSSDGSRIAFRSFRTGNSEIFVMGANGSRQWNISNNSAADFHPSFSPDGSRIAFATDRDGGQIEVYVMNWGGSNPVRYTTNSVEDSRPSWGGAPKTPPPPIPRLKIDNGNILIGSPGGGLLLRTPNGMACVKIAIDNAGALTTSTVPCS